MSEADLIKIRNAVLTEKRTVREFNSLLDSLKNADDEREKAMVNSQIATLKNSLKKANDELLKLLEATSIVKPLENQNQVMQPTSVMQNSSQPRVFTMKPRKQSMFEKLGLSSLGELFTGKKAEGSELEKETIKRLKKGQEKIIKIKEEKPSNYLRFANKYFSNYSKKLIRQKTFGDLEKDLVRSNMVYTPSAYISMVILTVLISAAIAFFLFIFFMIFNVSAELPIISLAGENIFTRFLKTIWLIIVIPITTFLFMYTFPSLERRTIEKKINQELPFATIHMSSIAGSMIEPSKIFSIIMMTGEYPNLEKEFIKLLNEINIYGFDFVTALKNVAKNSPSQKLAELFNGLATTINSGGDLAEFFEKRANSLLFDYRLDKEKQTKAAETFMDIYISVVIAAPMILMLLMMMMKISGLGVSLSTSMITLLMVVGVSLINIVFLVFLHIKGS